MPTGTEPAAPAAASRLASLDVFRGATIALMILVNNAGDWSRTWAPLLHAPWHGWTPTDLVFPFFLFIVGVAIPIALAPRLAAGGDALAGIHRRILRRSATLFVLGLALIWFPYYTVIWERVRIPGVLQRIAVVYLVAAFAYLHLGRRSRFALSLALLAGYWAAMRWLPVPGFPAGDLTPEGNFAFHVDHLLLGPHIWRYSPGPGDPEGILSTLPAIVTALLGVSTGEWLRSSRTVAARAAGMATAGLVLVLTGLALAPLFPLNKNLWSPTYVLFTGGAALLLLAPLHRLVDGRSAAAWTRPFVIFGRNAIVAYAGSSLMARLLGVIRIADPADPGASISLQKWLYARLCVPLFPDYVASFAWAAGFVLVWFAILWWLDRRRLYLRI
ncbi:MAG: acyltransferase family protein [Thermoanaerobaculia bacterium]